MPRWIIYSYCIFIWENRLHKFVGYILLKVFFGFGVCLSKISSQQALEKTATAFRMELALPRNLQSGKAVFLRLISFQLAISMCLHKYFRCTAEARQPHQHLIWRSSDILNTKGVDGFLREIEPQVVRVVGILQRVNRSTNNITYIWPPRHASDKYMQYK